MHITVYGLTADQENISEFSAIDLEEDTYAAYHYDYWQTVSEDKRILAEEIGELLSSPTHNAKVGQDGNGWYVELDEETIDEYFQTIFTQFKAAVRELTGVTEPEMKSHLIYSLYKAQKAVSDDTGSMIYSWENGWQTPQDFMRCVEPGARYYICGAMDAHY